MGTLTVSLLDSRSSNMLVFRSPWKLLPGLLCSTPRSQPTLLFDTIGFSLFPTKDQAPQCLNCFSEVSVILVDYGDSSGNPSISMPTAPPRVLLPHFTSNTWSYFLINQPIPYILASQRGGGKQKLNQVPAGHCSTHGSPWRSSGFTDAPMNLFCAWVLRGPSMML